jgi:hypothetical protein
MLSLELQELLELWGCESELSEISKNLDINLSYTPLNFDQFQSAILATIKILESNLLQAGPHRQPDWELGWGDNLAKFNSSSAFEDTVPGYFEKSRVLRWKQKYIQPHDLNAERKLLGILVDSLLLKFGKNAESIYEFGCGTGWHLFRLRTYFPKTNLIGLDWARQSQELIKSYAMTKNDKNLFGHNFDFFNPNLELPVDRKSVFLTVASLEQTHKNFSKFLDFILITKPELVINIEPIGEFLDQDNLLDLLSLKYFEKRKYLNGYYGNLKTMEKQGLIKIHDARRSYLGSLFIDGYSIVVWSPSKTI